jgi:hypothetical protein
MRSARCGTASGTHSRVGDHDRAAACYRHALEICRGEGDRAREALILTHLGDAHAAAGHAGAAAATWRLALGILDELAHPDADAIRARLDGVT